MWKLLPQTNSDFESVCDQYLLKNPNDKEGPRIVMETHDWCVAHFGPTRSFRPTWYFWGPYLRIPKGSNHSFEFRLRWC